MAPPTTITDKDVLNIKSLCEDGEPMTVRSIAEMLNIKYYKVLHVIRKHGIKAPYRGSKKPRTLKYFDELSKSDQAEIKRRFEVEGESREYLDDTFGMARNETTKAVKEYNWQRSEQYHIDLRAKMDASRARKRKERELEMQEQEIDENPIEIPADDWPEDERFDTKDRHLYQADISDDEFYKRAVNSKFSDLRVKAPASIYEDTNISNCRVEQ